MKAAGVSCEICAVAINQQCNQEVRGAMIGSFHQARVLAAGKTERAKNAARRTAAVLERSRGQ